MHPKIDRLVELVDAAGTQADPALQTHVDDCTICQAQVTQLHRLAAAAGGSRGVVPLPEEGDHVTDEEIIGYVNTTLSAEKHFCIKQHLHACGGCMKEVLLYRSHIAQACLSPSTAAVVSREYLPARWIRMGAWVRGLFHFSMPNKLWLGAMGLAAVMAVLVNMLWLEQTRDFTKIAENKVAMPVVVDGNDNVPAPRHENSLALEPPAATAKLRSAEGVAAEQNPVIARVEGEASLANRNEVASAAVLENSLALEHAPNASKLNKPQTGQVEIKPVIIAAEQNSVIARVEGEASLANRNEVASAAVLENSIALEHAPNASKLNKPLTGQVETKPVVTAAEQNSVIARVQDEWYTAHRSAAKERAAIQEKDYGRNRFPPGIPADKHTLDQFHGESAVAVVIGNQSYPAAGLVDAKYALQDAQSIKAWLISTLGVAEKHIFYFENATAADFSEIFGNRENPAGKLAAAIHPGVSDVFIYYSGHGIPDLKSKGAYFVPADADPNLIALSGYSVDTLFKNIAQWSAHSVTVVLDTNFSGHSAGGALLKNVSPALVTTELQIPKLNNVAVFLGASQGQINAWSSSQTHSLFTSLFLKGLGGPADSNHDGNVSALELQKYLQQVVPYEARRLGGAEQTPVLTQIQDRVLVNLR